MKSPLLLFCLFSAAAPAAQVGDTYQEVLAEKGTPKSQMQAGTKLILNYPDASIQLRENVVVAITPKSPAPSAQPSPPPAATTPPPAQDQVAAVKSEQLKAITRVKAIVNQPVAAIPRSPGMKVGTFPYWFHDGAATPDYANVDVRTTQELSYDKWDCVMSDQNRGVYYASRDLEFNPMTKFFYTDRSLPKKRLTAAEMDEINALYRNIAKCEQRLRALHAP